MSFDSIYRREHNGALWMNARGLKKLNCREAAALENRLGLDHGEPGLHTPMDEEHGRVRAILPDFLPEGYLSAPVFLSLDLSHRCNLHCLHCYQAAGQPLLKELETAQWFSLLEQAASWGVFALRFGGGEPFLHPDIFDLAQLAHGLGIQATVSTNGIFTKEAAEQLEEHPEYWQRIYFSLDGGKEHNDRIRGAGAFKRTCEGIGWAREVGIEIGISMHIDTNNAGDLEEVTKLALAHDAELKFSPIRPIGRGRQMELPSPAILRKVAEWVGVLSRDGHKASCDFNIFHLKAGTRKLLQPNTARCPAGQLFLSVSPQGLVRPCSFLNLADDPYRVCDIKVESLINMWHEAPILKRLRSLGARKECGNCPYLGSACSGGCLAVVAGFGLGDDHKDPYCFVEPRDWS